MTGLRFSHLFVVAILICGPVFAASRIASGEHANFSRLVIYDVSDDFSITAINRRNLQVMLESTASLDLRAIFFYIPRRRILNVSRAPGGLEVQLGCDCDVFVFEVARNTFAVDVVDADAVSYAAAENASYVFDSGSSVDRALTIPTRKAPLIEFPVLWESAALGGGFGGSMLSRSSSGNAEVSKVPGVDMSDPHFGVLPQSDQLKVGKKIHDAMAPTENVQNVKMLGATDFDLVEIGEGLRLHSDFSYVDFGSHEDRRPDSLAGRLPRCPDELREFFEVFLRDGQPLGAEMIGTQRDTLVVDDFDVLERYSYFFSLGFLEEARAYAKLLELEAWSKVAEELISLVLMAEVFEFPHLSEASGCGEAAELWVFLSGSRHSMISNEELLGLSEKFSRLPPRLRELLKVRMREQISLSEPGREMETLFENSWVLSSTRPDGGNGGSIDRPTLSDPVFDELDVLLDEKASADRLALESTAKLLSGTGLEGDVISSLNDHLLFRDNLPGSFDLFLRMKESAYVSDEISDGLFEDLLSYMRVGADDASILGFMMSISKSDTMRLDQDQQAALQSVFDQRVGNLRMEHDLPERLATEAEFAVGEEPMAEQGVGSNEVAGRTFEADADQPTPVPSGGSETGIARFGEILGEAETEIEAVREFLRGIQ